MNGPTDKTYYTVLAEYSDGSGKADVILVTDDEAFATSTVHMINLCNPAKVIRIVTPASVALSTKEEGE